MALHRRRVKHAGRAGKPTTYATDRPGGSRHATGREGELVPRPGHPSTMTLTQSALATRPASPSGGGPP